MAEKQSSIDETAGVIARSRRLMARSPRVFALATAIVATAAIGLSNEFTREPNYELDAIFPVLTQHDVGELRTRIDAAPAVLKTTDADGNTPLHIAALDGWPDGVDVLLSRGADVNAPNAAGQTPIHLALNAPHAMQYRTVELLLRRGASTSQKTADGRDAVALANSIRGLDRRVLQALQKSPAHAGR